jgi:competence protein ComEC
MVFQQLPQINRSAFHFLDSGVAGCVVGESSGQAIVINTGGTATSVKTKWVVLPFLYARGIQTVDTIFLTSAHKRHSGGWEALVQGIRVRGLTSPMPIEETDTSVSLRVNRTVCQTGDVFEVGKHMKVHVLAASMSGSARPYAVYRLFTSYSSCLVAMSLPPACVRSMITMYGSALKSTIMVVPSDWPKDESDIRDFILSVSPHYAIYAGGERHVEADTVFPEIGCVVYDVRTDGCISFQGKRKIVTVYKKRVEN